MSSGQKPRVRTFFPRMKVRRPHRPRQPLTVFWDEKLQPVWFTRDKDVARKAVGVYFGNYGGAITLTGLKGGAL
ncbi:hypothetical protein [Nocardia sp. CY41]|uniref:hypothetical protein n=1 Tax=Nocardia sp. CY41 TaxID=2608686 RepID=UPI001358B66C|nr:hypothetical protein [Nocardia sp. CY41]